MIRLLHTADWHLGATLEGVNRDRDHALFLSWLADQLDSNEVDALVVAGDVFDQPQPSAEASRLYFSFLSRIALAAQSRKVIVVGGNHDSGARLDAPRELLGALDIHVVGAFDRDRLDRCLCPVTVGDRIAAVGLAVPYVHEVRLGLRSVFDQGDGLAAQLEDRFAELYSTLADGAQALAPGAPLFATGHLCCLGAHRSDAPADIHLVGSLGGLSPRIFDPRIAYVALGHIHRGGQVPQSRAFYPGSPIALGLKESPVEHRVLLVDLPDLGEPQVRALPVPTFRPILELRGSGDELAEQLRALTWDAPLEPFVYAVVEGERTSGGIEAQLQKAAQANPRGAPRLVQLRPGQRLAEGAVGLPAPGPRLADLSPEEVFLRLCQARGVAPDEPLLGAFRSLLSPDEAGGLP